MSILFSNSVLVPLLFLTLLPLLLHLFSKARPAVYHFSSITFLRKSVDRNYRIKRPQSWLLLVLRTLIFVALILTFLKPLVFTCSGFAGKFSSRSIVIIVDATASMAYVEGSQTRFATACAEASEILSGLSSNDRANIIWLRSPCKAVFPQPGTNLGFLKNQLRQAEVTNERANASEAVEIAVEMLSQMEGGKEIYLVSDFQKTPWKEADLSVPEEVKFLTVKIGNQKPDNRAITRLYADPPFPVKDETVNIYAEVVNYSDQAFQTQIYLSAGQLRQTQQIQVQAWDKTTVAFMCNFDDKGLIAVSAQLDEDSFPSDNKRLMVLNIKEFLRAGILAGEKETARFWKKTLSALQWARPEYLSYTDIKKIEGFDILMVSGWDGEHAENLRAYLEKGGILFLYPGNKLHIKEFIALKRKAMSQDSLEANITWQSLSEPLSLRVVTQDDRAFEIFSLGEYGDPARGIFYGRYMIPQEMGINGIVLLSYEDDVPALVRFSVPGHLFLWNLPLQEKISNWARRVEYLPLLAELIMTARSEGGNLNMWPDHLPGETLSCLLPNDYMAGGVSLFTKDGKPVPIKKKHVEDGLRFVSNPVADPGLYVWKFQNRRLFMDAVNFPIEESDLRTIPSSEIKQMGFDAIKGGYQVRNLHEGIPLWPFLLAFSVFMILLESFLTYKFSKNGIKKVPFIYTKLE